MSQGTLRGLTILKDTNSSVGWIDLKKIVDCFASEEEAIYIVKPYKGLGENIHKTLVDHPLWTSSDQQRFVGIELTKTFNGLLKKKSFKHDIFGQGTQLRKLGRCCIGQYRLDHGLDFGLPRDNTVSIGEGKYPSLCLGKIECTKRGG